MFSALKSKAHYAALENGEFDPKLKPYGPEGPHEQHVFIRAGRYSIAVVLCLLCTSIVSTWILLFGNVFQLYHNNAVVLVESSSLSSLLWDCQQPSIRREWRTLSEAERLAYVNAVACLATKPSKLRNNGTFYDDFPWVHKHNSRKTHVSAPFLPWHRYYIDVYEKALKEECSFDGDLPYWDWSLDWNSFLSAPVWNSTIGFGGNGDATSAHSVGDGYCVIDGPFANVEVMFFDGEYQPHCLSRGFPDEVELKELGRLIHPEVIERLMDDDDYATFEAELERRAHYFLSHSVRGDLSRFTGPNGACFLSTLLSPTLQSIALDDTTKKLANTGAYPSDPVFFLHHTNLDRLWAQWQQRDTAHRLHAYNGRASNDTNAVATLSDVLDMG